MTSAGRNATVALVAAAAVMVAGRANAHDEPTAAPGLRDATIVLHVTNYAALSREVLDVASARVATIYERIGVRIVWVDGEVSLEERQDGRRHFSVLLLSRDMAEKTILARGIKDGVLAQAHVSGGRAHIFCDRIATTPGALQHLREPRSATSSPTKWGISYWVRIAIPPAASCAPTRTCGHFTSRVLTRRRPTPSERG